MKKIFSNRNIKVILFTIIVMVMFLPMLQRMTKLIAEKPKLNWVTLFDGEYQKTTEDYVQAKIGFRGTFVRIYNQLQYSLYNQARAKDVIIGNDGYLYEENYIDAYLGTDFIGEDSIDLKVNKLGAIDKVLKAKGIEIVVVLAPGKGSFYPEFIPDQYDINSRGKTNYEGYSKAIAKTDVHLVDFHQWFDDMKDTSRYPLFPKTGIHWSKYGEMLVLDSIITYFNALAKYDKIPELNISRVEWSNTMRDSDDDIERGMNLLFDIEDFPMAYGHYNFKDSVTEKSPKVLTVGDSYYWGMFNWGLTEFGFNKAQFWFYNNEIYPDIYDGVAKVSNVDIVAEVEKNDFILLLVTDANLHKFCFGFIDQLYDGYGLAK